MVRSNGDVGGPGWTNGTGPTCSDPAALTTATFPNCPDKLFQFHHQPLNYFASFAPGTAAGIHIAADSDFEEDPADSEIIEQIKELIETRVRPAVAQDGGDIAYKGYRDGRLYLTMHGACSGCR